MDNYMKITEDRDFLLKEVEAAKKRIRQVATQRNTSNDEKLAVIDVCLAEITRLNEQLTLM